MSTTALWIFLLVFFLFLVAGIIVLVIWIQVCKKTGRCCCNCCYMCRPDRNCCCSCCCLSTINEELIAVTTEEQHEAQRLEEGQGHPNQQQQNQRQQPGRQYYGAGGPGYGRGGGQNRHPHRSGEEQYVGDRRTQPAPSGYPQPIYEEHEEKGKKKGKK